MPASGPSVPREPGRAGAGRRGWLESLPRGTPILLLRERSHRPRRGARRRGLRVRLPRHSLHGDHRSHGTARGHPQRVVCQREGRDGDGGGRVAGGCAHPGHHEARRPQCGRRPVHDPVAHGYQRRPRRHQRRRPRHAFVAERTGQPQLRQVRQGPDARALRQPGGLRLRRRGLRALGGVRHAGHAAHDDPCLARPRAGAAARAGRLGAARLRAGHQQVRHGPAVRAAA